MALISDYLENKLANFIFRGTQMDTPGDVWVGLFNGDPKDENKKLELIGNGYGREIVEFDSPRNGLIKNSNNVIFHKATDKWDTVTHIALFDEEMAGNMLFHGEVSTPIIVGKKKNFYIKIGNLQVGFE